MAGQIRYPRAGAGFHRGEQSLRDAPPKKRWHRIPDLNILLCSAAPKYK